MAQKTVKDCPICGRPTQLRHQPFCSTRCANIDLGRWLGEAYRVPVEESETDDLIRVAEHES